jgi:peroxiredoxin Q/BCP
MKLFFLLPTLCLLMTASASAELEIGAPAPQVAVLDDGGETIDLAEALAQGYTLVYFYPKAHTPGCTKQACSLRDGWSELQERGVKVYGVSSDSVESQASFRAKHDLPFALLADTGKKVAEAFGKGRWSRQAYLFKDGVLVWRDLSAATRAQADDVLAALDELEATDGT